MQQDELEKSVRACLPERRPTAVFGEVDYYGASFEIACSIGRKRTPIGFQKWLHGVIWEKTKYPEQIVLTHPRKGCALVHRQDQEEFLGNNGFTNVSCVGAPILYAPRPAQKKIKDSLLVFPAHSLPGLKRKINEKEYVDYLKEFGRNFETIVVCLSPNCVAHGQWVDEFKSAGIPMVLGAQRKDQHALRRMAALFSLFETVTSNTRGSHIPYASYFGCRVSLSGPWQGLEPSLANHPFYKAHPQIFEWVKHMHDYNYVNGKWPFLFQNTASCQKQEEWGAEVLGACNKRDPSEVASLLSWYNPWKRVIELFSTVVRRNLLKCIKKKSSR